MRRFAAFLLLLGLGCGDSSDGAPIEVTLADLPCQSVDDVGIWQSAPPPEQAVGECTWFLFGANTTFVVEHSLGRTPSVVLGYIGFEADGIGSTLGTGDVLLHDASTDTAVTIRNNQNQTFYLRLVLF
ncbi:MAG: hypothetical protein AAGF92_01350 [Myxococcota bacterium]